MYYLWGCKHAAACTARMLVCATSSTSVHNTQCVCDSEEIVQCHDKNTRGIENLLRSESMKYCTGAVGIEDDDR